MSQTMREIKKLIRSNKRLLRRIDRKKRHEKDVTTDMIKLDDIAEDLYIAVKNLARFNLNESYGNDIPISEEYHLNDLEEKYKSFVEKWKSKYKHNSAYIKYSEVFDVYEKFLNSIEYVNWAYCRKKNIEKPEKPTIKEARISRIIIITSKDFNKLNNLAFDFDNERTEKLSKDLQASITNMYNNLCSKYRVIYNDIIPEEVKNRKKELDEAYKKCLKVIKYGIKNDFLGAYKDFNSAAIDLNQDCKKSRAKKLMKQEEEAKKINNQVSVAPLAKKESTIQHTVGSKNNSDIKIGSIKGEAPKNKATIIPAENSVNVNGIITLQDLDNKMLEITQDMIYPHKDELYSLLPKNQDGIKAIIKMLNNFYGIAGEEVNKKGYVQEILDDEIRIIGLKETVEGFNLETASPELIIIWTRIAMLLNCYLANNYSGFYIKKDELFYQIDNVINPALYEGIINFAIKPIEPEKYAIRARQSLKWGPINNK